MGKCLWFSVKIKVCQSSLSSPWSYMYPDLHTLWQWNPFSIFNASKMWNLGRTISFTLKYIEIRKHFLKYHSPPNPPTPPGVPAKAFACICVTIFYTLYGSGLLAQGGRKVFSSPKTPGLTPVKCLFYRIRNKWQ